MPVETLINALLALPESDRIAVIDGVWASLNVQPSETVWLSEARKAELDRRSAEMDANPDDVLDLEDVLADLKANP